jgi:hypothetical protein
VAERTTLAGSRFAPFVADVSCGSAQNCRPFHTKATFPEGCDWPDDDTDIRISLLKPV